MPRRATLGLLLVTLASWGCGTWEEAPVEQAQDALGDTSASLAQACVATEIESQAKYCTGNYQYSLKCHALMQSPACGVDPNSDPSAPTYLACRAATHPVAPDSLCGAGFLGTVSTATGLTLDEVKARAAQQWATARGVGAPDFDVPITCTQCEANALLAPEGVQRRIYAAAAMSKQDMKLHILAGTAWGMLDIDRENRERAARSQPPGVYVPITLAELSAGLANVASVLDARVAQPSMEGPAAEVRTLLRVLNDVQPYLPRTAPGGAGFIRYTQSFLRSMRVGQDTERRLTAIHSQADRYMDAQEFITETWMTLYDEARTRPALVGAAVDGGRIANMLGIYTTTSTHDLLTAYPLEPLKTLVLTHLRQDGSLLLLAAEADATVTSMSTLGLAMTERYVASLDKLDRAEQTYRTAISLSKVPPAREDATATMAADDDEEEEEEEEVPSESEAKDALTEAIKVAKAEGKTIKTETSNVKLSVSFTLGLLEDAYTKAGKTDKAKDLKKFAKALDTVIGSVQKYHESAIKTAEAVSNLLSLGATGFNVLSSAIFAGNILGAVGELASLFSDTPEVPVEQVVKDEAVKTRQLIEKVARQLNVRFDRIDKKLDTLRQELLIRLDSMKWEQGETHYDVNELQRALYEMSTDLMRLDRNIYAMMTELHRQQFQEATTYYLGYEARMQEPLDLDKFGMAESLFLSRATTDATGYICAGPPSWDSSYFTEDGVLQALMSRMLLQSSPEPFGYADSINFLREVPSRLLGLSSNLSGVGLANPVEWTAGAEAYAQLNEESPTHAAQVLGRTDKVMAVGTTLDAALRNINKPLFDKLVERYTKHWTELKTELATAKESFEDIPDKKLSTLDIFSGPDQLPTDHYLKKTTPPLTCDGKPWGEYETIPMPSDLNLAQWNHDVLRPLMAADNMDLNGGELSHCLGGHWVEFNRIPNPWGTNRFYRLKVYLDIRYKAVEGGTEKTTVVYRHTFSTNIEQDRMVYTMDANTYDPDMAIGINFFVQKHWGGTIFSAPATHELKDAARVTAVRDQVTARLISEQRAFYTDVVDRMEEGGDILARRAKRMSGSKLLWESYISLALPLSVEHDEDLRSLLYGENAALSGVDALSVDDDLNDVQDSYAFFASAETLPANNIVSDIDAAFTRRTERLHTIVSNILAREAAAGESEAGTWTQATLLRLRMSDPTPVSPN
ncbi:hypothetical protein ACLESO_36435 [Pyxidicoccus sp. 3LG]